MFLKIDHFLWVFFSPVVYYKHLNTILQLKTLCGRSVQWGHQQHLGPFNTMIAGSCFSSSLLTWFVSSWIITHLCLHGNIFMVTALQEDSAGPSYNQNIRLTGSEGWQVWFALNIHLSKYLYKSSSYPFSSFVSWVCLAIMCTQAHNV